MKITSYVDWFHDGWIKELHHSLPEKKIVFTMISAQVLDCDDFDHTIEVSKNYTICGILHIEGVKKITINNKTFASELKLLDKYGEILDFEIEGDQRIEIGIRYNKLSDTTPDFSYQFIEIECETHRWENIPTLDNLDTEES